MLSRGLEKGFRIGPWTVDPETNCVQRDGNSSTLEPRMMDLLVFLASNPKKTFSKEDIFTNVWSETFVTDSALHKCVSELRKILEEDPAEPKLILTVPRRGYRLEADIEALKASSEPLEPSSARWPMGIALAGGALVLFLFGGLFNAPNSDPLPDNAEARPTVLIARLENRTGDELLDGAVEVVLEGRLNDSGRVQVVSRARVNSSLSLMLKSTEETLTEKLALEVSKRDGEIDYVVSGRIDTSGSEYQVSLRLLDGRSQQIVTSNVSSARSRDDLLPRADDQAYWLLDSLRPGSPVPEDRPEKVTTRSLDALMLYSRGLDRYRGNPLPHYRQRNTEAAQLFAEAIRIDPEFASGHLMLAWSYLMLDNTEPVQVPADDIVFSGLSRGYGKEILVTRRAWDAMQRAMAAREHTSLVERAFIQGCSLAWQGEFRKAAAFYRLVADLQPEHPFAANNLLGLGRQLRDSGFVLDAAIAQSRSLRLHRLGEPLSIIVCLSEDLRTARELHSRMVRLSRLEPYPAPAERPDATIVDRRHQAIAAARAFEIWSLWWEGKYSEARAALFPLVEFVADLHEDGIEVANNGYAFVLAEMQAALGMLSDAEATQERYGLHPESGNWPELSWESSPAAFRALLTESTAPLGKHSFYSLYTGILLDSDFATSEQIGGMPYLGPVNKKWVLSLHSGSSKERIQSLKERIAVVDVGEVPPLPLRWKLSRELMEQGREEEAVQVLEEIVQNKNQTFSGGVVPWQKAALDLALAYRRLGRTDEAESLRAELAEMLQFADSDHPIRLQLQK